MQFRQPSIIKIKINVKLRLDGNNLQNLMAKRQYTEDAS